MTDKQEHSEQSKNSNDLFKGNVDSTKPDHTLLMGVGVLAVLVILVIFYIVANQPGPTSTSNPAPTPTEATTPAPVVSNWQVDNTTNPVTGVVTTVVSLTNQNEQNIYVRKIGKKLECYIETNEFLETMDNVETGVSTVQYRFDNGKVIKQGWSLGGNNEGLFYPGNCSPFIAQLRKSKSLAFEYPPADKVPATITFDVTGFPDEFKTDTPSVTK